MPGAYGLTLVTPPAAEPVSLAEAKQHCRVDTADDDALIAALIVAARQYVEAVTWRQLITATYDLALDGFPRGPVIELPRPPLQSVTSVTYTDAAGVSAVLAPSDYLVDTTAFVGRLVLGAGRSWPAFTPRPVNAVVVRFTAGYGGAAAVPQAITQAILLLVGHYYEHREAAVTTAGTGDFSRMPFAVESLLTAYAVPRA